MESMSVLDAVLVGALGMAALLFLLLAAVVAVCKVYPMLRDLTVSLVDLVELLKGSRTSLEGIRQEMAYMRAMATPQLQQVQGGEPDNPQGGVVGSEGPRAPVPFPAPVFDRFTVAPPEPDAELEDTVVEHLNQSDEDLVRMEHLEALRQRGQVVEDSDVEHEGIQVESE